MLPPPPVMVSGRSIHKTKESSEGWHKTCCHANSFLHNVPYSSTELCAIHGILRSRKHTNIQSMLSYNWGSRVYIRPIYNNQLTLKQSHHLGRSSKHQHIYGRKVFCFLWKRGNAWSYTCVPGHRSWWYNITWVAATPSIKDLPTLTRVSPEKSSFHQVQTEDSQTVWVWDLSQSIHHLGPSSLYWLKWVKVSKITSVPNWRGEFKEWSDVRY